MACPIDSRVRQLPSRVARQQHTPLAPKNSWTVRQNSRNSSLWLKPQDSEIRRASSVSKDEQAASGTS
jgi:hypothetical protein